MFYLSISFPSFEIERRGGRGGWKWEGNPMEKDGMPPVISMERKLMLIGFATRNSFHSSARSVELQLDRAGIKVELNFET